MCDSIDSPDIMRRRTVENSLAKKRHNATNTNKVKIVSNDLSSAYANTKRTSLCGRGKNESEDTEEDYVEDKECDNSENSRDCDEEIYNSQDSCGESATDEEEVTLNTQVAPIIITIQQRRNSIYLIYLTPLIQNGEHVFKFGKTWDPLNRFSAYPPGSVLLYLCRVLDSHHVESELYTHFKKNFISRKDYGNEYYQGDLGLMIKTIDSIIDVMNQRVIDDNIVKDLKNCYRSHLSIRLHDTLNDVHDDFLDKLFIEYQTKKERYDFKCSKAQKENTIVLPSNVLVRSDLDTIEEYFGDKLDQFTYIDHTKITPQVLPRGTLIRYVCKTTGTEYKFCRGGSMISIEYLNNTSVVDKINVMGKRVFYVSLHNRSDIFLFYKHKNKKTQQSAHTSCQSVPKKKQDTESFVEALTPFEREKHIAMKKKRDAEPDKIKKQKISADYYAWLYTRRPDMDEKYNTFYKKKNISNTDIGKIDDDEADGDDAGDENSDDEGHDKNINKNVPLRKKVIADPKPKPKPVLKSDLKARQRFGSKFGYGQYSIDKSKTNIKTKAPIAFNTCYIKGKGETPF